MQITLQAIDDTGTDVGSPFTCGDDDAGDYITKQPIRDDTRAVDKADLYGAAVPWTGELGNQRTEYDWEVKRQHADDDTAFAFQMGHADTIPARANLTILNAASTWIHSAAVIHRVTCVEKTGRSTNFRYYVTGGTLEAS